MGTVRLGRQLGPRGFSKLVALKQLNMRSDAQLHEMLLDEALVASRIRHSNVVQCLDLCDQDDELTVVLEYVEGVSLAALLRACKERRRELPLGIWSAILIDALRGLHAAHEAQDAEGNWLGVVHRDVSPANLLIGREGICKVTDFGIVRSTAQRHKSSPSCVRGKPRYMSPEQLHAGPLDRRADIYSAGLVLWEALTGQRFDQSLRWRHDGFQRALPLPSALNPLVPQEADWVFDRATRVASDERYDTSLAMARALGCAIRPASAIDVSVWVESMADRALAKQRKALTELESAEPPTERDGGPQTRRYGSPRSRRRSAA
jgi:serine/threonine-protein kinase